MSGTWPTKEETKTVSLVSPRRLQRRKQDSVPCFPPLITSARIGEDLSAEEGIDWITALQAPQIAGLLDRVELPASLFDERDLADKGETKTVSLVSFPCILPCILSLALYPFPCILVSSPLYLPLAPPCFLR